jgi:hypothetical protein
MAERMMRMNMIDLPKRISYDQGVLRLRAEAPEQSSQQNSDGGKLVLGGVYDWHLAGSAYD